MSNQQGNTWRIKVSDGSQTPAFITIGGEDSFDWTRASKELDQSSKDDGAYASAGYGSQSVTFSVNGKLKLPDPGIQRISNVSKLQPPECDIEVTNGAIVKYAGRIAVGNFSTTFPNDAPATYKFDMKLAAVPTVDDLGAAS